MRAVVTRVLSASVTIDGAVRSEIGKGLLVLLGVRTGDTEAEADWVADRICKMRIFEDENGKMNKSIRDAGGEILLVSQFSLAGTLGKGTGNRPDFGHAELPDRARELYERVRDKLRAEGPTVKTGLFGAHMYIEQKQDGPLSFVFEC